MRKLDTQKLTSEVKEQALKSGANLVGIVSAESIDALPPVYVGWTINEYTKKTTETMPDAQSIIVIGYHVWDDMLELAIQKGERWLYPGYFPLTIIDMKLTQFLETRGYKAVAYFNNSYKRLAQLAGFGNYGKNALIINPTYGPWIRLSPILTNAELTPDKPYEGDPCGTCTNCLQACPAQALTPYKIDPDKCLVGIQLSANQPPKQFEEAYKRFQPTLSKHSLLMCMQCQKACKYGKRET